MSQSGRYHPTHPAASPVWRAALCSSLYTSACRDRAVSLILDETVLLVLEPACKRNDADATADNKREPAANHLLVERRLKRVLRAGVRTEHVTACARVRATASRLPARERAEISFPPLSLHFLSDRTARVCDRPQHSNTQSRNLERGSRKERDRGRRRWDAREHGGGHRGHQGAASTA